MSVKNDTERRKNMKRLLFILLLFVNLQIVIKSDYVGLELKCTTADAQSMTMEIAYDCELDWYFTQHVSVCEVVIERYVCNYCGQFFGKDKAAHDEHEKNCSAKDSGSSNNNRHSSNDGSWDDTEDSNNDNPSNPQNTNSDSGNDGFFDPYEFFDGNGSPQDDNDDGNGHDDEDGIFVGGPTNSDKSLYEGNYSMTENIKKNGFKCIQKLIKRDQLPHQKGPTCALYSMAFLEVIKGFVTNNSEAVNKRAADLKKAYCKKNGIKIENYKGVNKPAFYKDEEYTPLKTKADIIANIDAGNPVLAFVMAGKYVTTNTSVVLTTKSNNFQNYIYSSRDYYSNNDYYGSLGTTTKNSIKEPDGHAIVIVGYSSKDKGGSYIIYNPWGYYQIIPSVALNNIYKNNSGVSLYIKTKSSK